MAISWYADDGKFSSFLILPYNFMAMGIKGPRRFVYILSVTCQVLLRKREWFYIKFSIFLFVVFHFFDLVPNQFPSAMLFNPYIYCDNISIQELANNTCGILNLYPRFHLFGETTLKSSMCVNNIKNSFCTCSRISKKMYNFIRILTAVSIPPLLNMLL